MKLSEAIKRARTRLILARPFYGYLLAELPIRLTRSVPQAKVSAKEIAINPNYAMSFSDDERQTLLAHLILHPALKHIFRSRRRGRDLKRWNVACDHVVNLMLSEDTISEKGTGFPIPEGWPCNSRFAEMAVERVYEMLPGDPPCPLPDLSPGDGSEKFDDNDKEHGRSSQKDDDAQEDEDEQEQPRDGESAEDDDESEEGQESSGGAEDDAPEDSNQDEEGTGDGDEDSEQDGDGAGDDFGDGEQDGSDDAQAASENGGNDFPHSPPPETEESLERDWQKKLVRAAQLAAAHGRCPGAMESLIGDLLNPVIPWQQFFLSFVSEIIREDYSFSVPDRRFIPVIRDGVWSAGVFLPDLYDEGKEVVVILDTSGSISDDQLQSFASEAKGILASKGITKMRLMACDTRIVYDEVLGPHDEVPLTWGGRGGTDFRPPIKRLEEEGFGQYVGIVYFTDLAGDYPEREPPIPLLWIVKRTDRNMALSFGDYKPPFGSVVSYDGENLADYDVTPASAMGSSSDEVDDVDAWPF